MLPLSSESRGWRSVAVRGCAGHIGRGSRRPPRIESARGPATGRNGPQLPRNRGGAGGIDESWAGSWRALLALTGTGGGRRYQCVEKLSAEIGAVAHGEDVIELGELALNLLQAGLGGH